MPRERREAIGRPPPLTLALTLSLTLTLTQLRLDHISGATLSNRTYRGSGDPAACRALIQRVLLQAGAARTPPGASTKAFFGASNDYWTARQLGLLPSDAAPTALLATTSSRRLAAAWAPTDEVDLTAEPAQRSTSARSFTHLSADMYEQAAAARLGSEPEAVRTLRAASDAARGGSGGGLGGAREWSALSSDASAEDLSSRADWEYVRLSGFTGMWIAALLAHLRVDHVVIAREVDNTTVDWTLGALLHQLSTSMGRGSELSSQLRGLETSGQKDVETLGQRDLETLGELSTRPRVTPSSNETVASVSAGSASAGSANDHAGPKRRLGEAVGEAPSPRTKCVRWLALSGCRTLSAAAGIAPIAPFWCLLTVVWALALAMLAWAAGCASCRRRTAEAFCSHAGKVAAPGSAHGLAVSTRSPRAVQTAVL